MENSDNNKQKNHLGHLLAYASPVLATSFLLGPFAVLQGIYAKYFGVALTTIAAVMLVGRLFDAITDPVIGYFSDRSFARQGTRKHFIIMGGVLVIISSYFLFIPGDITIFSSVDSSTLEYSPISSMYFLVCVLSFFLAWTLFEIPHLAWANELASDSQEKNKIYSFRSVAYSLGGLLFYAVPYLPILDTRDFTPETLQWSVMISSLLLLILLYVCAKKTPSNKNPNNIQIREIKKNVKKPSVKETLLSIKNNKPFVLFAIAFLLTGFGTGTMSAMYFFFIDVYLGLGNKFALISIVLLFTSLIFLWPWYKLSMYLSKKHCWTSGTIICMIGIVGLSRLTPGSDSFYPLIIYMVILAFGGAGFGIIQPSLLADIVDYSTLKSGNNQAGSYFSVYTLIAKANGALGSALGLAIAGWYGFDATTTIHTEKGVFGLHLSLVYIPATFYLLATVFILLIPINQRQASAIRRRLNAREIRGTSHRENNAIKTISPDENPTNSHSDFHQTESNKIQLVAPNLKLEQSPPA